MWLLCQSSCYHATILNLVSLIEARRDKCPYLSGKVSGGFEASEFGLTVLGTRDNVLCNDSKI